MAVPAPSPVSVQRERAAAAKQRRKDVEGPIHRSVVSYLRRTLPHGFVVHHSPNGSLHASQRRKSAELGTVPGWPDIEVVGRLDDQRFIGFMEVKAPNGRLSEEQIKCSDRLLDCGCEVAVVRSVEDARKAVSDWHLPSTDSLISQAKRSGHHG